MIEKKRIRSILTELAIITTILSFSPNLMIESVCSIVMYVFWAGALAFEFMKNKFKVDSSSISMVLVYIIWFVFTKIFYATGIYPSGGMGVASYIIYCVIFYLFGLNFEEDEKHSVEILNAFFIGQVMLTITLLPYLSEISGSRYDFDAKNQTGQMLGIGIVFGFFILFKYHKNFFIKVAVIASSSICLMALLIIGSRTPLIAIVVIAIVDFASKKDKNSSDYAFLFAIVVAVIITISFLGGMDFLIDLFMSGDSVSGDTILNSITSGRIGFFQTAIQDFIKSPIVGVGAWAYVDSFIIDILRCGGLLLLVLMLPISYIKMYNTYKIANLYMKEQNNDVFAHAAKLMVLFYFVVSLMEGYPPMGPGTAVFFLWILIGIVSEKERVSNAAK